MIGLVVLLILMMNSLMEVLRGVCARASVPISFKFYHLIQGLKWFFIYLFFLCSLQLQHWPTWLFRAFESCKEVFEWWWQGCWFLWFHLVAAYSKIVFLLVKKKKCLYDVTILRYQLMQVKVIVNLKGRENDFRNIAIELLRRFQNEVGEVLLI